MHLRFLWAALGRLGGAALLLLSLAAPGPAAAKTGYLVAAGDRGFLGDEEMRDVVEGFGRDRAAELVFVTDERTRASLDQALARLRRQGVDRVAVLPWFLSKDEGRYRLLARLVDEAGANGPKPSLGRSWGDSYLATEALGDRLAALPAGAPVLLLGAADEGADPDAVAAALRNLAGQSGLPLPRLEVRVAPSRRGRDGEARWAAFEAELKRLVAGGRDWQAVGFHLGSRLDGHMSLDASFRQLLPQHVAYTPAPSGADLLAGDWLRREAARTGGVDAGKLGVVMLAHGSDYHWNETMRGAIGGLEDEYLIEYAFSMADPVTVERALRRLERRGAQAAVVVRVFGLKDSFRASVERMLGLDVENGGAGSGAAAHAGHPGHGEPAGRIVRLRTGLLTATAGGLEADPLFARALLARAQALAVNPAEETVILVAHGSGDDRQNERWLGALGRVAEEMGRQGGDRFKAIRFATWREDWPDQREPWIKRVREWVAAADGKAIVVPARTTAQGPEARLLEGLKFRHASGFAPHPLFAEWFEAQIAAGREQLAAESAAAMAGHAGLHGHH